MRHLRMAGEIITKNYWAASTLSNRLYRLQQFRTFLAAQGLTIAESTLNDAIDYIMSKKRGGMKESSLKEYLATMRHFARRLGAPWADDPVLLDLNCALTRTAEDERHALPLSEADMRTATSDQALSRAERAVIFVCWKTASRVDEVRRLTAASVEIRGVCPLPTTAWERANGIVTRDRRAFLVTLHWGSETKTSRVDPHQLHLTSTLAHPTPAPPLADFVQAVAADELSQVTTARIARILGSINPGYSAHSIKRGAAQKLATLVQQQIIDPTMLPMMLKHQGSARLPQTLMPTSTVRYINAPARRDLVDALGSPQTSLLL